ncbi:MAG: 2-oxoacid:acceptor oxidoreductase family protein [Nitrososphaerales archaeon]|jgi:2-oxoacid:acceptor oxidoreductase gamma subunit (pyruvate/2-ketoisovalerate family)
MMKEVRFHGRGGQGVVSAAQMLADAAVLEGKYVQAFPEFGAERSGAPIAAYARFSDGPIEIHSFIRNPDVVVVVDKSMAYFKSTTSGLAVGGYHICNYDGPPSELRARLGLDSSVKVLALDATGIAMKSLGKDFPNTPMLGALLKATELVGFESLSKVLGERFKGAVGAGNAAALKLGYEGVKAE